MTPFLVALGFLTRLPIPALDEYPGLKGTLPWFPAVGLLIGILLFSLNALLGDAPALLNAALTLAAWIAITGALHLDGVADCADAFVGGHGDREKILHIMKDSHTGAMGVVAVVVLLLIKFAALASLTEFGAALLLAPLLARAALPVLFLTTPYVRDTGMGSELGHGGEMAWRSVIISALVALLFGWAGIVALVGAFIGYAWMHHTMMNRIGGSTGDTAGATVEVVETAVLVLLAL